MQWRFDYATFLLGISNLNCQPFFMANSKQRILVLIYRDNLMCYFETFTQMTIMKLSNNMSI
jgi:hypothetical protein